MRTKIIFLIIMAMVSLNVASGQKSGKKIKISGHVVDGTLTPVANAIVMLDGEKSNAVTDQKGHFKVKVKPGNTKIGIFTMTNGILEEPLDGRKTINFKFEGSVPVQVVETDPLDEAVDIGYGSVKKRSMTGTVNRIDGTNPKYASYRNIYDMIRGEVAGVQVNGNSIRIQGASSLMLSTEPLFVVDGMVVNSISDIQPYNVKSIEILKGSSASIYGSRGANGVILIKLIGSSE
ncbi:MAG: TonB-dependent receptor plug domain-containing protein [Bacteroidales bacterium]|jgi:TonB-dependent SusC/RagA subfamily outer membrane receptor|nr:TonB-dependent receptor plug domain-containing protein [Bacteroidales bacterium]